MKKIPCLFRRDFSDQGKPILLREVTPGCEWVTQGEGVATRKWDGTACLVRGGKLFKRYDAKVNRKTGERPTPPAGWEACDPEPDPITGHWTGWVPVGDEPESKWHREAASKIWPDGTYELVGPKVNGNPENFTLHVLVPHGETQYPDAPRDFDGLRAWFEGRDIEGLVFHRGNGQMAKIRLADFGLRRPAKESP